MSNVQVQLRRGSTNQHSVYTGPQGEVTVDTDKNSLILHDGTTTGGIELAKKAPVDQALSDALDQVDTKVSAIDNFRKLNEFDFLRNAQTLVITGDSLSYNRYDFDSTYRTNAYDCRPGMKSWSFMLRDFRASQNLVTGDELNVFPEVEGGYHAISSVNSASQFLVPFSNRYVSISGGLNTEFTCSFMWNEEVFSKSQYEGTGYYLHTFCTTNTTTNGKFDIYLNGTLVGTVDNTESANWQGWEPISLYLGTPVIGENIITIKNFRNSDGTALTGSEYKTFFLNGISSGSLDATKLTGRGSMGVQWVVDNLYDKITQYTPDAVCLIIGANDRSSMAASTFKSKMEQVISGIKQANSNAKLLMLTPPPSGGFPTKSDDPYMEVFSQLERENDNVYLYNLYNLFEGLSTSIWRFDNIHFNKFGNSLLTRELIRTYSSQSETSQLDSNFFNASFSFSSGNVNDGKRALDKPQSYVLGAETPEASLSRYDKHLTPSLVQKAYRTTTPEGGGLAYVGWRLELGRAAGTFNIADVSVRPLSGVGGDDYVISWMYSQGTNAAGVKILQVLLAQDKGQVDGEFALANTYPAGDMLLTIS